MKTTIDFFITKPLVANVIFVSIFFLGFISWKLIGKEELPEFESNWVRITVIYPGATPKTVELSVTKLIEDELKSVTGIEQINTTSTQGAASLSITIDDDHPDSSQVFKNIQEAVYRVKLPVEIRELPTIRQFKSSEKAILDIGMYLKGQKILDNRKRAKLQALILKFENQIRILKEISSLEKSHYLKPQLNILVSPEKLLTNELSLSQVYNQISQSNLRIPLGAMFDSGESRVILVNELESPETLKDVMIQGNYSGHGNKLGDICERIENGFERTNSIFKVNGHEAIFINVKKSSSVDILSANQKVLSFIEKFKQQNKEVEVVLMDDESDAVKNRLSIISINAIIGFFLILLVLFVFLDFKTGLWVAMGIPFSLCFTIIFALLSGYTVNNMTLAAIIIVLGVVVDDAIIIAENISRLKNEGYSVLEASRVGVYQVAKPIFASIITTCLAFIPLIFFEGFFGKLIVYIPLIVCLMLIGSLFESLYILPTHLINIKAHPKQDWFSKYERFYERIIELVLNKKIVVIIPFISLIIGAFFLFKTQMSFVMFPREESKEVYIKIKTPTNTNRFKTSKLIGGLESFISLDKENVVGVRSSVGLSRRGGETKENEASILVEVKPVDQRNESLQVLIDRWKNFSDKNKKLESVKYLRGRWGHSSSNAIEILVQESSDTKRKEVVKKISEILEKDLNLINIETDEAIQKKEFYFNVNQSNLMKYKVLPSSLRDTLRSYIQGSVLYSINKGAEDIDVVLSVSSKYKKEIKDILNLNVVNSEGNLVSINKIVEVSEEMKPINIKRSQYQRSTMIYANLKKESDITAINVAEFLEKEYFPKLELDTSILTFKGEIEDSREAKGQFKNSIIIVVTLIFLVLLIMFNSFIRPFIILSIVPFGLSSIVYVLFFHGMKFYGFFSLIGAIGMIGVVVNDAIVMISKFDAENKKDYKSIAKVASTRLRPIILTTLTTVVGVLPTAYGFAGSDSILSEMMLVMGWGLAFGTFITLFYVPIAYSLTKS